MNHKNIHAQNSNTNSSNQIAAVLLGGTLASGKSCQIAVKTSRRAVVNAHATIDRNVLGKGGDPNDESPIVEEKKKALDVAQTASQVPG